MLSTNNFSLYFGRKLHTVIAYSKNKQIIIHQQLIQKENSFTTKLLTTSSVDYLKGQPGHDSWGEKKSRWIYSVALKVKGKYIQFNIYNN